MDNSTALATVPESPLALMPVMSVEQAVHRYKMMVQVVRELLNDGTDYGAIPGTDKPTLLKPGAEKLCTFFGLHAHFVVVDSTEDWEGGFFYYRYQCQLKRGEHVIAAAEGSANSREKKYRYRSIPDFKATKEEKANAIRREEKTARNGSSYQMLTIENPEPFDLVNTLQKMAQKRSHIASCLLAVNASEFFTQDLEDFADHQSDNATPSARTTKTGAKSTQKQAAPVSAEEDAINARLLDYCIQEKKNEKNGKAFFEAMYAKKTLAEKAELVKSLKLNTPGAEPAQVLEGEVIESQPLSAESLKEEGGNK